MSETTDRVTAREVDTAAFTVARWRLNFGYDEQEVDDFLDRVAATLAADSRALEQVHTICAAVITNGKQGQARDLAVRVLTVINS